MSTAESTEIPTSEAFIAAASLMPSPMKPTVCPFSRRHVTMRAFCCGVSLAKMSVRSAAARNAASSIASTSEPSSREWDRNPTCPHTLRVTASLSPVSTLTATPYSFSAATAAAAESFGGSRKARYPMSTMSDSSATENAPATIGFVLWATAMTRSPASLYRRTVARISSLNALVSGSTFPLYSA